VRFAALLVSTSFTVVATSVLLLDPTQNAFDKSFPKPGAHYHYVFAGMVVEATQVLVVITLLACAAVTAFRVKNQDRAAYAYMQPMALVVLAGVLLVAGSGGYLPGPLAALLLAAALGLVTYGTLKTAEVPTKTQNRTARAQNRTTDPHQRARRPAPAMPSPAPVPNGAGGQYYGDVESGGPNGGRPGLGERMYGQITVFTLVDGRTEVFDQLASAVVQAARTNEPDLLVFSTHDVAGAPNQRIFYQLFRDRAAYEEHQRLPHVRQFLGQSRAFVSATNVIELALNSAKVVPLPSMGHQPQRGYQG
jgi:quinol monooxygenase YgiN